MWFDINYHLHFKGFIVLSTRFAAWLEEWRGYCPPRRSDSALWWRGYDKYSWQPQLHGAPTWAPSTSTTRSPSRTASPISAKSEASPRRRCSSSRRWRSTRPKDGKVSYGLSKGLIDNIITHDYPYAAPCHNCEAGNLIPAAGLLWFFARMNFFEVFKRGSGASFFDAKWENM